MSEETAEIRDQLGNNPETFPVLVSGFDETLAIEEGPAKFTVSAIGESWIVGSSTNGIVGPNTGTQSGAQQVVGSSGRTDTVIRVINPFNTFRERFRFNTYIDSGNTTATVDLVTNFRVDFTAGQVFTSEVIFKNDVDILNARIIFSNTGTLTSEISSDNGVTFTQVENNEVINFSTGGGSASVFPMTFPFTLSGPTAGQELIYRFTETGGSTATLDFIQVQYNE